MHKEIEPNNSVGKYAVAFIKGGKIVKHLLLRKNRKIAKTVFTFSSWSMRKMRYNCDWQGSKSKRWWWNAGTFHSTLIREKVRGGDIKIEEQTHPFAQAKMSEKS